MINPVQLFTFRLKNEWSYHYGVWKTAVDWIVWLYILIPFLAVFSYQYYLIWNGEAGWLEVYPTEFSWFFFFFISTKGTVRLFLDEGDLLFLRQNKRWLDTLMSLGMTYSFFVNMLLVIVVSGVFLPIWYVYEGATISKIVTFILFVCIFRISHQLIKQILAVTFQNWKLVFINLALYLGSFVIFLTYYLVALPSQLFITGLVIITGIVLCKTRLNMKWCFNDDCLRETQERLKLASLFVKASGFKVEKGNQKRKKPFILFSKSARLFRKRTNQNLIAETFIKYYLRSKSKLFILIQVTIACIVVLVLVPNWVKWILLFVCAFMAKHLVISALKEFKNNSFIKLLPYDAEHDEVIIAASKAVFILTTPSLFLFGFVAGWTIFSPFFGLLVGLVAVNLNYLDRPTI
ncbi:ABC transporter permease [Bacillaceae bacterium IKA-2]|nr:ABC transporter permease [Bacillaceae bacterium IKA-2]